MDAVSTRPIMALPTARLLVGITLAVLAVLMVLSFFAMSWIETVKDSDDSEKKVTPLEIWQGKNDGDDFTMQLGKNTPKGGFDDVRFVDRLLIIMPLLGMAIGLLTVFYILTAQAPRAVLITIAALAFLFMIAPYLWDVWSSADWKSGLKDMGFKGNNIDQAMESLTETQSMGEFALLGLLAFLVSLLGLSAESSLPPTLEHIQK